MTTPRQIRNTHAQLETAFNNHTTRIGYALAAITHATRNLDGYPSTASGADRERTGTAELTSVERAVDGRLGDLNHPRVRRQRIGPTETLERLSAHYTEMRGILAQIENLCDQYTVALSPQEIKAMTCTGDGTPEGATCRNIAAPDRKGMCIACYTRQRRRQEDVT